MVSRQRNLFLVLLVLLGFSWYLYSTSGVPSQPPITIQEPQQQEKPEEPTEPTKPTTKPPTPSEPPTIPEPPELEPEPQPAPEPVQTPKQPSPPPKMEPVTTPPTDPEPSPKEPEVVIDPNASWVTLHLAEAKKFDFKRHCLDGTFNAKTGKFYVTEACMGTILPAKSLTKPTSPIWIMIVGDSNFRRIYNDLCAAFGLSTQSGVNQFSDRDCKGENVHISLRFSPLWSHHGGVQGQKVEQVILHPEIGVDHVALENGGYTWDFEKPWTIEAAVKPLVIWNFGLWELMGKDADGDENFHRRVAAVLQYRLKQIKEAGTWHDNWTFVTTPSVRPADDRRKGLLTDPRISALNAIQAKSILESDHQVIDWFKLSKQTGNYLADGYHLDGKLYEFAFQSIVAVVNKHIVFVNEQSVGKSE